MPVLVLFYFFIRRLAPRIFCWVSYACRLIVSDLFDRNSDVFEYFEESFSEVSECYCAMMRESSLDKYVTIETSHFRNSEYTNCSKGTSCNRKNLAVCNVSTKFVISCALQTIECDISRFDISFQSSVCNFYPEEILP